MSRYSSKYWNGIKPDVEIPYYDKHHRTLWEKIIKIRNTLLELLAYACPLNALRVTLHRWRGVHIGDDVYIGMYCIIDNYAPEYIYLEDDVSVNAGSMILTHFNPKYRFSNIFDSEVRSVVIRSQAMISVKCIILPGVEVGTYSVISAGSVIEKNIPPYRVVTQNISYNMVDVEKLIKR